METYRETYREWGDCGRVFDDLNIIKVYTSILYTPGIYRYEYIPGTGIYLSLYTRPRS
jgi:hypothetical protein